MAETVKMCDMEKAIVIRVFRMLNDGKIKLEGEPREEIIITDIEPDKLVYPEGWYYAKGCFRNKHTSTTGIYDEVLMKKPNGKFWEKIATYCTLTVKMCDMEKAIAIRVFRMLNDGKIKLEGEPREEIIITDIEPDKLVYPEGWYYAKGCFRNKHTSTTGIYDEVLMKKPNGKFWGKSATYCTLN